MHARSPLSDATLDRMLAEAAPPVETDPSDVPRIVRRAAASADLERRGRRRGGLVAAATVLGLAGIGAAAVGPVVFPDPTALHDGDRRAIAAVIRLHWQQPDGRQATCGYQPWYVGRMSAAAESTLTAYVRDHDWSALDRRLIASGSLRGWANVPPQLQGAVGDATASTSAGARILHVAAPSRATPPPDPAQAVAQAFQAAADSIVGAGTVHFGGVTLISCGVG